MNIAAIYDKYDLWGKVRVKFSEGIWTIWIDNVFNLQEKLDIKRIFEVFTQCSNCEGTGEVPAPHYTKGGEVPDCDFEKCKSCNGTGERDAKII